MSIMLGSLCVLQYSGLLAFSWLYIGNLQQPWDLHFLLVLCVLFLHLVAVVVAVVAAAAVAVVAAVVAVVAVVGVVVAVVVGVVVAVVVAVVSALIDAVVAVAAVVAAAAVVAVAAVDDNDEPVPMHFDDGDDDNINGMIVILCKISVD